MTIPREAGRKAFDKDARLNGVYEHISILSAHLKPPNTSTYVCDYVGAILGPDAPCSELSSPVFIDNGQSQALDSPFVNNRCTVCRKLGVTTVAKLPLRTNCRSLPVVAANRAVKRKNDGNGNPDESHGTKRHRWCDLKARSRPYQLLATQQVRNLRTPASLRHGPAGRHRDIERSTGTVTGHKKALVGERKDWHTKPINKGG
jgi:hypothetical protein